MEEAPPPSPPAKPPPVLRTPGETAEMTFAAIHPSGHEELFYEEVKEDLNR